jgi:intracellular sulfur oxidation DsrE/DsrF family protein
MNLRAFAFAALVAMGPPMLPVSARAQVAPIEKAFVEHRVVFQLSDATESKQRQVLNNVENVMKFYGPDKVVVEVVAFGPGIDLLRDDNAVAEHMRSLTVQGVRFDACQNTIDNWERDNGRSFPLISLAQRVPAGVVQIIYLTERGFTNIRP